MSVLVTLQDEADLREMLYRLNDAGESPEVAGQDGAGPFLASFLDGDGELDIAIVRAVGEDLHAHDDNAEQLCTPAGRLGDYLLYWPVLVLDLSLAEGGVR